MRAPPGAGAHARRTLKSPRFPRRLGFAEGSGPQIQRNCFLLPTRPSRQKDLCHEFDKSRVGLLASGVARGQRCLSFHARSTLVNHRLVAICKECLSIFPLRLRQRHLAMASGISLAAALTVASYPAAAYQSAAGNPAAAVTAAAVTTTAGCGKPAAHTGLFNLNTTDGMGTI